MIQQPGLLLRGMGLWYVKNCFCGAEGRWLFSKELALKNGEPEVCLLTL